MTTTVLLATAILLTASQAAVQFGLPVRGPMENPLDTSMQLPSAYANPLSISNSVRQPAGGQRRFGSFGGGGARGMHLFGRRF
ncbi:hypothetical protein AAVH_34785, partial [Aphelenchoides avenae]